MIVDLIIRLAKKRPYRNIGDYMHRWWILPESWNLPIAIRVNHIRRADRGEHLHNHPFNFRTVIMRGWYIEEDVWGNLFKREPGDIVFHYAEYYHRIVEVSPGGCWTFFMTGRRRTQWGFLVDGRYVHHDDYFAER